MKKTVCLIGRPNVGKSTIFNRLIRENKSIILQLHTQFQESLQSWQ